jgi:hypothetical protein
VATNAQCCSRFALVACIHITYYYSFFLATTMALSTPQLKFSSGA